MIEKELQEIEQRLGMEFVQFSINFPKQYKDLIRLIAEVRNLKDELESWQGLAHDRLKNWCMFAERSSKLEKENMVYKVTLEKHISILRSVLQVIKNQIDYDEGITLGGVIVQLEKALEGDTNEN